LYGYPVLWNALVHSISPLTTHIYQLPNRIISSPSSWTFPSCSILWVFHVPSLSLLHSCSCLAWHCDNILMFFICVACRYLLIAIWCHWANISMRQSDRQNCNISAVLNKVRVPSRNQGRAEKSVTGLLVTEFLQCFVAVGWVAGRASGL